MKSYKTSLLTNFKTYERIYKAKSEVIKQYSIKLSQKLLWKKIHIVSRGERDKTI